MVRTLNVAARVVLPLCRVFAALQLVLCSCSVAFADDPQHAVQRAIEFLSGEVPRWRAENNCYSCHNNGDAVRALAWAAKRDLLSDRMPLSDSIEFLIEPESWDANGPDGPFKDEKLARIQFSAALADLTWAGLVAERRPLRAAAALLVELQYEDGSWPADADGTLGSPVTYGRPLATAIALCTLREADSRLYKSQIERAQRWFLDREPRGVLDAAASLIGLADVDSVTSRKRQAESLRMIAAGEATAGGWGPFVTSAPEVFDTAVVLIALEGIRAQKPRLDVEKLIGRGRNYLFSRQLEDGSWPATTRPPGVDSYAQRVSTTGWALQALLSTGAIGKRPLTTPESSFPSNEKLE